MLAHWIWLSTKPAIQERTALNILQSFPDISALYHARDYSCVEGITKKVVSQLMDKSLDYASAVIQLCKERKIQILTYADSAYPSRLKNIYDPPLVLYYKGQLPEFDAEAAIAVVGTRKATTYGCVVAKRMGYQITKCGGLVVTGLAAGIDGMAAQGALIANGAPVGVFGCGVDVVYPRFQEKLFQMVERKGCLISEFTPGTPPNGWNFPKRNRLLSGLSCGVVVVEAPAKSGALITAQHALDQGRDVFAVPGNVGGFASAGSNQLLRSGAIVAQHGWDVMSEYVDLFPGKVYRWLSRIEWEDFPQDVIELRETPKLAATGQRFRQPAEKSVDNSSRTPYHVSQQDLSGLSAQERAVYAVLTSEPQQIDQIIVRSGLNASEVLASITLLEVKGMITRHPGKYYSQAKK